MLGNVETPSEIPEALDRVRHCGTIDDEFFAFVEWLNAQPEPTDLDEAGNG
jgi:hypothetical protein